MTGWPAYTIVGGQVVYEQGQFHTEVRGEALRFDGSSVATNPAS